ncbi:esterase/lipase family protein [Noviherbaspirillum sp.]|uniref:esterase/lipase family protein n=1 Tax=Noviherbaspirillum sp. TaxID=1926288 RepID=UPI002FE1797D
MQRKQKSKMMLSVLAGAALLGSMMATSAMAQTEPLVFVHGYSGSTSNFNTMVSRFTSDGYPSAKLYRFGYNSLYYSNKSSADQLRNFVNSVRSKNAYQPISIVAHSNGGLVSRWYRVKLGGTSTMRRFVTLGTPHKGTTSAYACFSAACFEMRPGSSFLNELAGQGCDRSLWSSNDGVISPATNAQCGTSVQTASVSHTALLSDASVYSQLRQQLR